MKNIKNWDKASVADIESNGFLDVVSKIHIVGIQLHGREDVTLIKGSDHQRIKAMLNYHIDNEIPIVFHNGICFDIPAFEKVLNLDLSKLMIIDTLPLSWYLNTSHQRHSVESLSSDYDTDIEKYFVDPDDWENLEWDDAVKRVTSDVILSKIIWDDFKERLKEIYLLAKTEIDVGNVGGKRVSESETIYIDSLIGLPLEEHINRLLTFLMFKIDCIRLQEKTKWKVDVEYLKSSIEKLEEIVGKSATELEAVMPPVPVYADRKKPAKMFKKNGELSTTGDKWEALKAALKDSRKDKWGNLEVCVRKDGYISELIKYDPPNINGHQQVKDFLTSHGWIPQTFKAIRDKEAFSKWLTSRPKEGADRSAWNKWKDSKPEDRLVPQIRVDGGDGKELCPSVVELAEEVPEIRALEGYSVAKHRLDTMKGILERVDGDGCVEASAHGFTNSLRLKHRAPIVNLPSANKLHAEPIRGSLIAKDGFILTGSDLSSLESRVAHHFMIPHDPEYVETMSADDFDPHILMALSANLITQKEFDDFKLGVKTQKVAEARQQGKTAGYAAVYGGGASSIAKGANIDIKVAEALHKAYWNLNWSVKTVAEEQVVVKDSKNGSWLINPINGFCYSVRSEKDYFSTLAQGTGAFMMDMWLDKLLSKMEERWGGKTLTANVHRYCAI